MIPKGTLTLSVALLCALVIASTNSSQDDATTATIAPTNPGDRRLHYKGLFEGDLKISEEMIRRFYNLSNTTSGLQKRSVASEDVDIWGQIIPYRIDSNAPFNLVETIRDAMDEWEDNSCLRFITRSSQRDYIFFTHENECSSDGACCSETVGRMGGRQFISLPDCNHKGIILHEIGHALGFWHEQSRPDRDSYVTINWDNIKSGQRDQFNKRNHHQIDYQGVGYDYGSIMHYRRRAFSTNNNPTITENNPTEYNNQGRPYIGQRTALSDKDIEQANRLYKCSGSGIRGILKVYVRYGRNLPDTNPWLNDPNPYVKIKAVDSYGNTVTKTTSEKSGTENPNWYQWLDFGGRTWQFFRVRVWDKDWRSDDDAMSMSQTVPITGGYHWYQRHCTNTNCDRYVYFDYNLIVDGCECCSNPCQHGGTCTELISSYSCSCTTAWEGTNCQHMKGYLKFYVRYGTGLPDRDGWFAGDSDPYTKIIAYDSDGNSVTRTTSTDRGDESPEWNQWLYFGTDTWKYFTIKVYDRDLGSDDSLSNWQTVTIYPGPHRYLTHSCHSGYIKYDYFFD